MENNVFIDFVRRRIFAEKINDTFSFFKQNFNSLLKVLAGIYLPVALLVSGAFFSMQFNMMQGAPQPSTDMPISFFIPVMLFGLISVVILHGVIAEYIKIYQQTGGEQPGITAVFNELKKDFGRLLGAYLLIGVIIFFSFFFFIIPAVYFSVVFSFSFMTIVWEKSSPGGAITRCMDLIQGHWWNTFGLILIFLIIQWFFLGVLEAPFLIWMGIMSWHSVDVLLSGDIGFFTGVIGTFFGLLYLIASTILPSIMLIGVSINYFSILEEKEAPALMEEINQVGEESRA